MDVACNVSARVITQTGRCAAGHKVGDSWIIGHETPAGICIWAWNAIFPFVAILRYGGGFSSMGPGSDSITLVCPDPYNRVEFEVRRGEPAA